MKIIILLSIALVGIPTFAQTNDSLELRRFFALAQIESGNQDIMPKPGGDIGRFQISQSVWKANTKLPPSAGTNPITSLTVAEKILKSHITAFEKKQKRPATNREFYLLWHRPKRVLHPRPDEAERAKRFDNLCQ